jgi:2-dehydro-3-deoxy-L-rhamnonate dehydrogenase (NAD+)
VNLNGPFYCCKAILPIARANGYGRIVNVASIAGKEDNAGAAGAVFDLSGGRATYF